MPLRSLLEDEFQRRASIFATGESLVDYLADAYEIYQLRSEIAAGKITAEQIEQFVRDLLRDFHAGTKFPWDTALAGIALALAYVPGSFANGFLRELDGLRVAEIPMCPRVARIALMRRANSMAGLTKARLVELGGARAPGVTLWVGQKRVTEAPAEPRYAFA